MDEFDDFLRLGDTFFTPFVLLFNCMDSMQPSQKPESNGMAEAFVKTFKRDYVYVHDRSDAETVMAQLAHWFEDYNEHHPHEGLKMKSPRQFIRSRLLIASCPEQLRKLTVLKIQSSPDLSPKQVQLIPLN